MGLTVVVGSSQLITTLSAFAYLRWRGMRSSMLRIVSLKSGDLVHSTSAFEQELGRLALEDGHHSTMQFRGLRPTALEPLVCDLLLLPRLDDQEGLALQAACNARSVVELGESIGVETRLYSMSARRARARALRTLVARHGADGFSLDPLIPIDAAVALPRLRCLLEVCQAFSQQLETSGQSFNPLPLDAALVCLPYLKIRSWRFRFKWAGRKFGLRQPPSVQNVAFIRDAIASVRRRVRPRPVLIQLHPKNRRHLDAIRTALGPAVEALTVQVLSGDAPLEVLLARRATSNGLPSGSVAGFGTNLLAAAVFLYPHHERVELCLSPQGWWQKAMAVVIHHRELLRRRHVQATLVNLQGALRQLSRQ